jgi:predicted porin
VWAILQENLMRKYLLVSAMIAMSGIAGAQSSVTVFGIVDATLRDVKNGSAGSLKSLSSGALSTNRLGFRGTENLGDGLQAGFWLEHGFNIDTGTQGDATRFWNRRSTVSLGSKSLGEVRLGRDYSPSYTAIASLIDPFGDNGLGAITTMVSGLGSGVLTITRADNLVSYFLPDTLGGVFGQASVAPGENTVGAKYAGGTLGWVGGNVRVVGSYAETTITTDKYKQTMAGGSYDFGVARLSAELYRAKYKVSRQRLYFVAVSVPVGPGIIKASYSSSDLSGPAVPGQAVADADDARRLALGYVHNLSKRTALYATVASIQNKGASKVVLLGGPSGLKAGENSSGYEMGLRHSF